MYRRSCFDAIMDLERELGVDRHGLSLGMEGHSLSQMDMVRAQQQVCMEREASASLAEPDTAPDGEDKSDPTQE